MSRPGRGDRGAVTAELAMVLPLLLAVTAGLAWLLSVALVQVRVTDAAREAARAVARGDDPASAVALAQRVAPAGSSVSVSRAGDEVTVRVTSAVTGPGGLVPLPGATASSESVALLESAP